MSRLPTDGVWVSWFGERADEGQCPVCCQIILLRNHELATWKRCFIIPIMRGGKDVFPNVIPCCPDCTNKVSSKNLFDYLQQHGKIDHQNRQIMERKVLIEMNEYNPICEYFTGNGMMKCQNRKRSKHDNWCKRHLEIGWEPMDCSWP